MNKEYLEFITLVQLRYNIDLIEKEIRRINEQIKFNTKYNIKDTLKYNHEKKEQCLNLLQTIYKQIKSISAINDIAVLDDFLLKKWPSILAYLLENPSLSEITIYDLIPATNCWQDKKLLDLYKIYFLNTFEFEIGDMSCRKLPFYAIIINLIKDEQFQFLGVFFDIIDNKLFNPNCIMGASQEPLWTLTPNPYYLNNPTLTSYQEKIILDDRTNYYMTANGSDPVACKIKSNCETKEEQENNLRIASKIIIDKHFSVLDSVRLNIPYDGKSFIMHYSLLDVIFKEAMNNKAINDLRAYLLSKKGINEQIESAHYREPTRNNSIDEYIKLIREKNSCEFKEEIRKLEFLKF